MKYTKTLKQQQFYDLTNQYLDFVSLEIVDNQNIYILDRNKGIFIFQLNSDYDWKFMKQLSRNSQGNYLHIIYLPHQTIKKSKSGVLIVQQTNSRYKISIYLDETLNYEQPLNLNHYGDSPLKLGSTPNYLIIKQKYNIFIYKLSNLGELFGTIQQQTVQFYTHSFEDEIFIFTKTICQKYFLRTGKIIFNAGQQKQLDHQSVILSGAILNEYCNVTLSYTIHSQKDSKLYPPHEMAQELVNIEYPELPNVYLPYYQDVTGPNIKLQIQIQEFSDPISVYATHLEPIQVLGIDIQNNSIFVSTVMVDFENYLLLIQKSNFDANFYICHQQSFFKQTCQYLTVYNFYYKLDATVFKWYVNDKNQKIYFGYLNENKSFIYLCQIEINTIYIFNTIKNQYLYPFEYFTITNDILYTHYGNVLLLYHFNGQLQEVALHSEIINVIISEYHPDKFFVLTNTIVSIITYQIDVQIIKEIKLPFEYLIAKIFVHQNSLVIVYKGLNFQQIQQFSLFNYSFQRELPLYNYHLQSYILSDFYDKILILQAFSPVIQQEVLLFYDITKSSRDSLFLVLPIQEQMSFQIYGIQNHYFLSLLNETDRQYNIFKLSSTLNQIINQLNRNDTTMIHYAKIKKTYNNDDYPIEIVQEQSLILTNLMTNIYMDTQSLNSIQINLDKTKQKYQIVLQDSFFQGQILEYSLSCLQCGEATTGLVYLDRKMQFQYIRDFGNDEIIKVFQLGECLFVVTATQLLMSKGDMSNIDHQILIPIPQDYKITSAFPSGDDVIVLQLYNDFEQIINFYKCSQFFDCALLVQYLIPKDILYIIDIKFIKNNLVILTIEGKIHFFGLVSQMESFSFEQSQTTYQTTDSMSEMIILSSEDDLVKLLLIQNIIENGGIYVIDLIYDGLFLNPIGNQLVQINPVLEAQGLLTANYNYGSLHLIQYSYSDETINIQLFVTTYSKGAHYGLSMQLDRYITTKMPILTVDFVVLKYKSLSLKYYVAIHENYIAILNQGYEQIVVTLYLIPKETSKILTQNPIMPIGGINIDTCQHLFVHLYTKDNKIQLLLNRNSTQIAQYIINTQLLLNIQNIDLFLEKQPITLTLDNYISQKEHTFKIIINFEKEKIDKGLSFMAILMFSLIVVVILIIIGICVYYIKCKKKKKKILKKVHQ